jgi:hypothetical protein
VITLGWRQTDKMTKMITITSYFLYISLQ